MKAYKIGFKGNGVVAESYDVKNTIYHLKTRQKQNKEAAPYIQDEINKLEKFLSGKVLSKVKFNEDFFVKLSGREIYSAVSDQARYEMAYPFVKNGILEIKTEKMSFDQIECDEKDKPLVKKLTVGSFLNLDSSVVWRVK